MPVTKRLASFFPKKPSGRLFVFFICAAVSKAIILFFSITKDKYSYLDIMFRYKNTISKMVYAK